MTQYVKFLLGEQGYGVDIGKVQFIEVLQPTTHLPGAESYVRGVIHLRNQLIPVIDLRAYFGLQAQGDKDDSRIIVAADSHGSVGLLVDAIPDVLEISNTDIGPIPEGSNLDFIESNYLEGIAEVHNEVVGILALETLMTEMRSRQSSASTTPHW